MIRCFKPKILRYHFNFSVRVSHKQLSADQQSEKIKVEWKTYDWKKFDQQLKKKVEKYKHIVYKEQLKLKKDDFIKAFRNVLITLTYDEKIDETLMNKQQELGEKIFQNTEDAQPLSSENFKEMVTGDILSINEDENGKKILGKYSRILENEDEFQEEKKNDSEKIEEIDLSWKTKLSKIHEMDYPDDFKKISNHFEEFIKDNPLQLKKFASYYTHFWHWSHIEMRKTRDNKNMLIVPFNPQSLSGEVIKLQKENLREYFSTGPGKECNLDSLYFHLMNPKYEYNSVKQNFELLYGLDKLKETCDGKEFDFHADNFYPQLFESYEKLNLSLAKMFSDVNKENGTNKLIEFDGANGVLGTLTFPLYEKFYTVQNCFNTTLNTRINLEKHGLKENEIFLLTHNIAKSNRNLNFILKKHSEDSRFCFVYQDLKQPMHEYQRIIRKKHLILLRSHKQIKSILLVTNSSALFKLEQYCYELMSGERKREGLFGEPFYAVSASLIDQKPKSSSCLIIVRLDRD
ncbi:unnamed protein product [Brachionus calyciflorus]|uniref:Uncharacterized protein n=1 Tax=Brachionus calyciflorus TaxID=104777 RepID=A0A813NZ91_9BILA|nr:unnamed protein product [Brachionus calyciflorus]